ncbi:hypothetical protein COV20_01125 [Candidatus Woesearchaeota archaeon CG10_big_fil_rev_8_21_14_0_10_45_16]|nr:MAG: hypothetical protein COV20_01125 [Candidatus Woesearchaeota archaeon CG10_big_fil_rev_8_21_14_0_10_45_16]
MKKVEEEQLWNDFEVEEERPSRWKKPLLFMLGMFMIFLTVSYIIVGYPISSIIEGQLESDALQNNVLNLDSFSLIFINDTEKTLQSLYFSEQKVEFSVCLSGYLQDDDYYITSLYQPAMFEQAFDHVSFEPCSTESLIFLHTHPYKSCIASDTDINTLKKMKARNNDVLMVVMCEPDRFSVYG